MTATVGPVPAWRFITAFGVVSLLADLVYEGARAVTGPYLATLGASATLVGLVTGAGEAVALAGRLGTGPLTDRTRAYWSLTLTGYALTLAAVPLLGAIPALGIACALVIAERAGKAIRSPAKDVMLSHAAAAVGRGRGFAVHEALDQIGAIAGPLLVAAILASTASYRLGFAALAVPGTLALIMLLRLRARVPDPARYEPAVTAVTEPAASGVPAVPAVPAVPSMAGSLPRPFWVYLGFVTTTSVGYATFGVLSYHLAVRNILPSAAIAVLYAAAMAVDALAALATGWLYDRAGLRALAAVPVLAAAIPMLAFSTHVALTVAGALLWGAVLGIQESTARAAVADLVPTARRGSAYGIFAVGYGAATLAGSVLAGALYTRSIPALIATTVTVQLAAITLLPAALAAHHKWMRA